MLSLNNHWIKEIGDETLSICVDTSIYPLEVIFRTCYVFTDRCYLFLSPDGSGSVVKVSCTRKTLVCDLEAVAGEFSNELIDQKVRMDIAAQTRTIRELIVAQAFAEAGLLDGPSTEEDFLVDSKGIIK